MGITADKIKMSETTAKRIRTLTVPPVIAFIICTVLYIAFGKKAFAGSLHYFEALFTLSILPLLSYPVCALIPKLREKGRRGQRNTAIVFSVIGYVAGTLLTFFTGGTRISKIIYLTYLFSGVFTALLSFGFKYRASGHTCGVSGPIAMLTYCFGPLCLPLFLLLIPIFLSSLKLKRHTMGQLAAGCFVPIAALVISIFITGAAVG